MTEKSKGDIFLKLKSLKIKDKKIFDEIVNFSRLNSESSFANLFIWSDVYNTKYTVIDEMLCVFYTGDSGVLKCIYPFGNGDIIKVVTCIRDNVFKGQNSFVMTAVCEEDKAELEKAFGDKVCFEYDRDSSEYVYLSQNLATLSGKKLHTKRNHINKFVSTYEYTYKELNSSIFNDCIQSVEKWMHLKYEGDRGAYENELGTIKKAFQYFDELSLSGGAIYVGDKLVAFCVGEQLNSDTAVVHIEKADIDYQGSFALINRDYVKNKWKYIKYINREEDLGIEGLRKAKLSYYPEFLVDKYVATFNF